MVACDSVDHRPRAPHAVETSHWINGRSQLLLPASAQLVALAPDPHHAGRSSGGNLPMICGEGFSMLKVALRSEREDVHVLAAARPGDLPAGAADPMTLPNSPSRM